MTPAEERCWSNAASRRPSRSIPSAGVKKKAPDAALAAVAKCLNATIVEQSAGSASMHAVSSAGGHVALLAKLKETKLKVDIKATDASLAALVAEDLPCLSL